ADEGYCYAFAVGQGDGERRGEARGPGPAQLRTPGLPGDDSDVGQAEALAVARALKVAGGLLGRDPPEQPLDAPPRRPAQPAPALAFGRAEHQVRQHFEPEIALRAE